MHKYPMPLTSRCRNETKSRNILQVPVHHRKRCNSCNTAATSAKAAREKQGKGANKIQPEITTHVLSKSFFAQDVPETDDGAGAGAGAEAGAGAAFGAAFGAAWALEDGAPQPELSDSCFVAAGAPCRWIASRVKTCAASNASRSIDPAAIIYLAMCI
jgi:hypothetical protein